jgi:hypothetical protein
MDFLPKMALAEENNNSFGVQEGEVTPLESTYKEEFVKAFVLDIKRSANCVQIGWVLAKKKKRRNSIVSFSMQKNAFRF